MPIKGDFDSNQHVHDSATRAAKGIPTFAYSASEEARHHVHPTLDPRRIRNKIFHVLESRDTPEFPEALSVFVTLDVTGSNITCAREVQKTLPGFMTLLKKYVKYPQVAVGANDDYGTEARLVEPERCIQVSEFETGNELDKHILNITLVNNGGGNNRESVRQTA